MFKWHKKIIEQHIWTKPKIRHVQKDNNHLIIYFTALKKSIESDVHLHVYLSVIIHLSTYAICWIYLEVPVYITKRKFLHQVKYIISILQHLPTQMNLLTSAGKNMQLSICLATFSPSLDGRSHRTTLAPCLVNLSTVARPSPEAPPLTKLTNPYKTTAIKNQ